MPQVPSEPAISSVQNPQVRRLVALKDRREREREGQFVIEGARELARALAGGVALRRLYACPELYSPEATQVAREAAVRQPGLPRTGLSRAAFARASHRENPDGLLALADLLPLAPPDQLPPDALLLVLAGLEKPGNLGALLRTADGVGAAGVLLAGRGTDPHNPNVVRASQGSLFTQPVFALPDEAALGWLRAGGFRLCAATPEASTLYWDADLRGRVAVVLGAEHDGLPPLWRAAADLQVALPMHGAADSLNVGTAGALLLYEALRQRRPA